MVLDGFSVTLIMRCLSLSIPEHVVRDARLYTGCSDDLEATCRAVALCGQLVAEARRMRSRLDSFQADQHDLERREVQLLELARQIISDFQ